MVDANGKVKMISDQQKLRFFFFLFCIWDGRGEKVCSASSRISKHYTSIKNSKLIFRCHLDFSNAEPMTQTCCWYVLIWHQIPSSSVCTGGWTEHSLWAVCEATWWQKFYAMSAKLLSEQMRSQEVIFSTVGLGHLALPCWKGTSWPLLFQLNVSQINGFILVFQSS